MVRYEYSSVLFLIMNFNWWNCIRVTSYKNLFTTLLSFRHPFSNIICEVEVMVFTCFQQIKGPNADIFYVNRTTLRPFAIGKDSLKKSVSEKSKTIQEEN